MCKSTIWFFHCFVILDDRVQLFIKSYDCGLEWIIQLFKVLHVALCKLQTAVVVFQYLEFVIDRCKTLSLISVVGRLLVLVEDAFFLMFGFCVGR